MWLILVCVCPRATSARGQVWECFVCLSYSVYPSLVRVLTHGHAFGTLVSQVWKQCIERAGGMCVYGFSYCYKVRIDLIYRH